MKWFSWLSKSTSPENLQQKRLHFVDLMPSNEADEAGHYADALNFAIDSPRIRNIALTGPYGSGKSSVLHTFEKTSSAKFLNISLACFKEESEKTTTQEDERDRHILIERSILQQLLYGVEANRLPYSRFKRIRTPQSRQVWITSSLLLLWLIAVVSMFYGFKSGFDIDADCTGKLLAWFSVTLSISPLLLAFADIYRSLFRFPIKKISASNGEIELGDISEQSILNRHLDEIIYFFQESDFRVVVFEDLDRFGSPEIFVKLREINKLINDNAHVDKCVKFIYALKDHMFADKQRTKFFDFIIPVLPVINSSNSLDKLRTRLPQDIFTNPEGERFLREVSWHLNDLRLIHNIVNEFQLYYAQLQSDKLNAIKLLAILIYKNVYPKDFEELHLNKGAVYSVILSKSEMLSSLFKSYQEEIASCEKLIEDIDKESMADIRGLVNAFIGNAMSMGNIHATNAVIVNNNTVNLNSFNESHVLHLVQSRSDVSFLDRNGYNRNAGKNAQQIEAELCPNSTFEKRFARIRQNSSHTKLELQNRIQSAQKSIREARLLPLKELIVGSKGDVNKKLTSLLQGSDTALLEYLIRNGHVDESYHDYISVFYEGRLTRSDREFLISIRAGQMPEPTYPIDTPKEICQNMRSEDFSLSFAQNVKLIDYLLVSTDIENKHHLKQAFTYLSENFKESQSFLLAYFDTGEKVAEFVLKLSKHWPEYGVAATRLNESIIHIAHILHFNEPKTVAATMNQEGCLTTYIEENIQALFSSLHIDASDFDHLAHLGVCVNNLHQIEQKSELLAYVHKKSLYAISPENLQTLLLRYGNGVIIEDCEQRNYTTILGKGTKEIQEFIAANISEYVEDVLLQISTNEDESAETIAALLKNDGVDLEQKKRILQKQKHVFEATSEIPETFWGFSLLEGKLKPTWSNLGNYTSSSVKDDEVLTKILCIETIVGELVPQKFISSVVGKEKSDKLASFIINCNELHDESYIELVKCAPFTWNVFPEGISEEKTILLARHGQINLNDKTFAKTSTDPSLRASLIQSRFKDYTDNKTKYLIDDEVRGLLLLSTLDNAQKIQIINDIVPTSVKPGAPFLNELAKVLLLPSCNITDINVQLVQNTIMHSNIINDRLLLLHKLIPLIDKVMVIQLITGLPQPYCEIGAYGSRPTIPQNDGNLRLAHQLKEHGVISSFKEESKGIRINTFRSAESLEETEE